jgi:radical SAM protein with 4Fe4S-binding SPASM domain
VRHRLGPRRLFDYYLGGVNGEPVPPMGPSTRGLARRKSVCGAAATGCAVNPYGDFLPCLQLLLPFGSVRERRLRDMWERPPEEIRRLRRVTTYGHLAACRTCDLIVYCRRCHGLAHLEAGGWASCDPLAREMARVTRAVVHRMQGAEAPEPRRAAGGAAASAAKGDGRS